MKTLYSRRSLISFLACFFVVTFLWAIFPDAGSFLSDAAYPDNCLTKARSILKSRVGERFPDRVEELYAAIDQTKEKEKKISHLSIEFYLGIPFDASRSIVGYACSFTCYSVLWMAVVESGPCFRLQDEQIL